MAKKIATLFRGRALKQLRQGMTKTGGRNNHGRITSFHRGGGAKRAIRQMDMKRSTVGLTGTVERIEYDPCRTGRTALIRWDDPETDDAPKEEVERGCGRVRDLEKGVLPRGIRDLGRREAREVVAKICGVPVVERKVRERVMVTIDGRRKFSSAAVDLRDGFHQELSKMNTERAHCAEDNFNNIVTKVKNSTTDTGFRNAEGASCGLKVIAMEKNEAKMVQEIRRGMAALL